MNPIESRAMRGAACFALVPVLVLAVALGAWTLACGGDETPAEPEAAPAAPAAKAVKPDKKKRQKEAATAAAPAADPVGVDVTIGDDAKVPKDFPSDVPIYPGARPTATMSEEGQGTLVTFDLDDGPEKVYDFYQQQLADGGWEIASSASMGGQWMIRALKDDRAAHISIAGSETGSQMGVAVAKAE
jgi:hypothetical protein